MGQRDITAFKASMKRKKGIPTVSMCRLDVKKEVEPAGGDGALSSSRYMLGRGVKRKLSSCEDPAQDLPYPQQRQLVLDLCLDKLQSCQQRAEPSLHRSVLLANTLRQIQQEMRQEGETCLPPAPLGPSLPLTSTPRHFPDLPPVPLDCPPPLSGALSPSFPFMTAEDEEVQLCSTENETLLPSLAGEADTRSSDSLFSSFEITNSTSYLTDLPLDDIFEDIDTSMYDSSDISVLSNGCMCTSSSSLQLCLSDINDLDHIMEILVRS
ncbi:cell division cycle-associated protein 4-like [Carassius auratus]|uniref:Cell division cycle-associated protein 4-like n=2 Tax=Carassius TaxID=7956 RepID=A0A6P6RP73_CARAU|nr:cell division cycle-associated protein 4-like [Carassius auratus]XP_052442782.1 cell division cycle-associated protein 4-like isoform X1 [Carassius gibelio]